jgi:hypothetical protein
VRAHVTEKSNLSAEGLGRDMVDGRKLGLLSILARSKRRRVAASLLFSIAVGLTISSVVPLLFAFKMCESFGCSNGRWVWVVLRLRRGRPYYPVRCRRYQAGANANYPSWLL